MVRSRQCGGAPPGKHAMHANSILPTTPCMPVHKRCPGVRILIYCYWGVRPRSFLTWGHLTLAISPLSMRLSLLGLINVTVGTIYCYCWD